MQGGRVIGASDRIGACGIVSKRTPEHIAATIYDALGIPRDAQWVDIDRRLHHIYRAKPLTELM